MLEVYHMKPDTNNLPQSGDFINNIGDYTIIDNDFDLYNESTGEVVAKFRKNKINDDLKIEKFVEANRVLFKRMKENRGASAGNIDRDKLRLTVGELINKKKYRTGYIKKDGTSSNTQICNLSKSNTIGYLDTAVRSGYISGTHLSRYNLEYPLRYQDSIPLVEDISTCLKEIDAKAYKNNKDIIDPKYRIGESVFSTVTLNSSWQSATHKDTNNGHDCFAVMLVLEDYKNKNEYIGGHFLLPEFKLAFNVRKGDIIMCNTQKYLHCNSPLEPYTPSQIIGSYTAQQIKNNWHLNRLSVVCYIKKCCIKK